MTVTEEDKDHAQHQYLRRHGTPWTDRRTAAGRPGKTTPPVLAINVPLALYIYGRALREGYLSGSWSVDGA